MALKINNVNFSEISEDIYGRMDVDFFAIQKDFNLKSMDKLRNYITFLESGKAIKATDYENGTENIHITVRNIDDGTLNLDNAIFISDEKADKLSEFRLQRGDVVIAISSNCGEAFVYDEELSYNLTLSHYLCRIRLNKKLLNEKYLILYMRSALCRAYFRSVETGKTIKNLAQYYIKEMPIYVPPLPVQLDIVKKAEPILLKINNLKSSIESLGIIIDKIFIDHFHYDFSTFNNLKKQNIYKANFKSYGNNIDTRFSAKFHRPAGEFVYSELKKSEYYKLKNVVSIPMITGQGISNEYDENGICVYVSMADISTWELDLSGLKTLSSEYEKKNQTKKIKGLTTPQSTKLAVNDIIMMRSGEGGIGKVAIVKDEINAIFCDFLIRIRFDESMINPLFAYYYFRTTYFQYLVEINKKGLGNNTNIFPNNLNEFPIPNISLKEQKNIISQIEEKIRERDFIKKQIATERKKIDKILEELLT